MTRVGEAASVPRTGPAPLVAWPRAAAATALGCAVVVAVLGVIVHGTSSGTAVDDVLERWVHRHFDVYALYDMVQLTTPALIAGLLGFVALGGWLIGRRDVAVLVAVSSAVAVVLAEWVLKPLVGRTNPVVTKMTGITSEAYPSGHETGVSTLLAILALLILRAQVRALVKVTVLVVLAGYFLITAVGLVGQYYHYPSDTLGALALALGCVLATSLLVDRTPVRLTGRVVDQRPTS